MTESLLSTLVPGGGNRAYYESEDCCKANYPEDFTEEDQPSGPWNSDLRANPHFVSDEDDEFDSTYAHLLFNYPGEYADDLKALAEQDSSYTPSEKWSLLLNMI